jgi:outer membrane protein, adhesin transport system
MKLPYFAIPCFAVTGLVLAISAPAAAQTFSINEALLEAARSHPGVGEASANKRATETELRQTQSTLLPQVRIDASWGPEKFDQNSTGVPPVVGLTAPVTGAGPWRNGSQESVVVRQLLFDGFASIHEIWRQTARVDAAAFRVREHTELIALDAAEAYVNVVRYLRLVSIAEQNLANHERIFSNVNSRFSGGRAGEGDLEQARERVENARASLADFQKSLEDGRAAYRKTVGIEPINLRFPSSLRGMPPSRDEALAIAVRFNPTILAAQADADAAKHAYRATDGSFAPKVFLQGSATHYDNSFPYVSTPGLPSVTHEDYSGKVVLSWDIFRGGQDTWHRSETAERFTEATMRHARLQRDAVESIDKAWSARTVTATRIAALMRQLEADRKTIVAFQKEYELGQRSLIDLLNAQNQYFNAQVSLTSSRGVVVFADYQLLAAMGTLLEYLKAPPPVDAAPVDLVVFNLPVYKPPTLRWTLPQTGSEPLRVAVPEPTVVAPPVRARGYAPDARAQETSAFTDRWQKWTSAAPPMASVWEWLAQKPDSNTPLALDPSSTGQATSYAETGKPHWLATGFPPDQK